MTLSFKSSILKQQNVIVPLLKITSESTRTKNTIFEKSEGNASQIE